MRMLFQLLGSRKLTLILLVLLALCTLLTLPGERALPFLRSLGLHQGLLALPVYVLLGLLLFNQFSAAVARLLGPGKPKSNVSSQTDEDGLPVLQPLEEEEEKPKSLPLPGDLSVASVEIKTSIPQQNLLALLRMLGFRVSSKPSSENEDEGLEAKRGASRPLFTTALYLGLATLLAAFVVAQAVHPPQKALLPLGKSVSLSRECQACKTLPPGSTGAPELTTPWRVLLKKANLLRAEAAPLPSQEIVYQRYQASYQRASRLQQPSSFFPRFSEQAKTIFVQKKALPVTQTPLPALRSQAVRLAVGNAHAPVWMAPQQSRKIGPYRVTFHALHTKASLLIDGQTHLLELAPLKASPGIPLDGKLLRPVRYEAGFVQGQGPIEPCLRFFLEDKGIPLQTACLAVNQSSKLGTHTLALQTLSTSAEISFRQGLYLPLLWFGLAFFLFGFLGCFFFDRLRLFVAWDRSTKRLVLFANGFRASPFALLRGLAEGLSYTPDPRSLAPQGQGRSPSPSSPRSPEPSPASQKPSPPASATKVLSSDPPSKSASSKSASPAQSVPSNPAPVAPVSSKRSAQEERLSAASASSVHLQKVGKTSSARDTNPQPVVQVEPQSLISGLQQAPDRAPTSKPQAPVQAPTQAVAAASASPKSQAPAAPAPAQAKPAAPAAPAPAQQAKPAAPQTAAPAPAQQAKPAAPQTAAPAPAQQAKPAPPQAPAPAQAKPAAPAASAPAQQAKPAAPQASQPAAPAQPKPAAPAAIIPQKKPEMGRTAELEFTEKTAIRSTPFFPGSSQGGDGDLQIDSIFADLEQPKPPKK